MEPPSQIVPPGSTVVFSVRPYDEGSSNEASLDSSRTGNVPAAPIEERGPKLQTYQWYWNAIPISSEIRARLVIHSAASANDGSYSCVVNSQDSSNRSQPTHLRVQATSDPGRLIRISARTFAGTEGNHLIAGFAVGGLGASGNLPVLIRASGPALAGLDMPRFLPDPVLRLKSVNGVVGFNRGWKGAPYIADLASALGAAPWESADSHDAALVEKLPIGIYTAEIFGDEDDTGFAMVEVFDATPPGSYQPSSPRLMNISVRSPVGKGANILVVGFVIGGSTSKTILIRGAGPSLTKFGIPNALGDPCLLLYRHNRDGSNSWLESNTKWGGDADITQAAASAGAFAWDLETTGDSAILVTLPPGAYNALLSGASGDTGVGLVEVYDVP
jgi:hypothetical protein